MTPEEKAKELFNEGLMQMNTINAYFLEQEIKQLQPVLDAFDKAKQQLFDDKKIGKLHSVHYKSTLIKVAIDLESLAHSLRHFAKENKKKEDNGL